MTSCKQLRHQHRPFVAAASSYANSHCLILSMISLVCNLFSRVWRISILFAAQYLISDESSPVFCLSNPLQKIVGFQCSSASKEFLHSATADTQRRDSRISLRSI